METILDFNQREVKVHTESEANEISNSYFVEMGIPQSKYPFLHCWETPMQSTPGAPVAFKTWYGHLYVGWA